MVFGSDRELSARARDGDSLGDGKLSRRQCRAAYTPLGNQVVHTKMIWIFGASSSLQLGYTFSLLMV